jgi:RHS repeat-associated protein
VYNIEDRLTEVWDGEVSTGSLTASYYYDPFGRRLWKDVGGTRTHFLYADEGLIGEFDGSGQEIKTYGYKPGSMWTTDPLFMKEGGNYYFYHNDHLGTPQKLTSTNGAVVWSAKYNSFGEATVDASSTITNPLRFPGQHYDQETGLYYNYHRYYDTVIGKYLRPDPILSNYNNNKVFIFLQYLMVDPEMTQKYNYAISNPINWFDQRGLARNCPSGKQSVPNPNHVPQSNGCGPEGWKKKYVPERPFNLALFTPACNNHDLCYDECNRDKDECDTIFREELKYICEAEYVWMGIQQPPKSHKLRYKGCLIAAKGYFEFVSHAGHGPYNDAQEDACICK